MARPPEDQTAREKVVSTRINEEDFAKIADLRGDQSTAEWLRELIEGEIHR